MKHDVWVEPHGPEPIKQEREAVEREPTPKLPALQIDDIDDPNNTILASEWIEGDGGGDVLFEESEFYGAFSFRDTILEQLDRYWVYIARMRRNDPDAYEFYRQLGATLRPYLASWSNMHKSEKFKKYRGAELEEYKRGIKLTPWFKQHWPSFGCICYGANPLEEQRERTALQGHLWCPKFLYFSRINSQPWPWFVQPVRGGKLYLMTIWWDRPDQDRTRKWGVPNDFPIWVSDDGATIRALKTREASNGNIRSDKDWRIPFAYQEWARQYGMTAQTHLTHLFCDATADIERTYYSTCRVAVTNGDLTAVFGIEPQRLAYFFRDRDVTLNAHGHKQRIFHVVRPHVRADGQAVPMQFRGLREFEWAGYHVSITVPGRDHLLLQEFDVPLMILKPRSRLNRDQIRNADVATWLKEKIKASVSSFRR